MWNGTPVACPECIRGSFLPSVRVEPWWTPPRQRFSKTVAEEFQTTKSANFTSFPNVLRNSSIFTTFNSQPAHIHPRFCIHSALFASESWGIQPWNRHLAVFHQLPVNYRRSETGSSVRNGFGWKVQNHGFTLQAVLCLSVSSAEWLYQTKPMKTGMYT